MQSGGWFQKGHKNPNAGFKKGRPSPFKGQTKETNPAIMKRSITATGKKRSAKSRKTMSVAQIKKFQVEQAKAEGFFDLFG